MTTATELRADEIRRRHATRSGIIEELKAELERAYAKHGQAPWGRHEWHSIALEELEEAWDEVKADGDPAALAHEIIQIAAVCIRYLEQAGDRYQAATPPFQLRSFGHEPWPHEHDWRGQAAICTTPGCFDRAPAGTVGR